MQFRIIPVTPFVQNCTLLWCEHSQEAAVVDPGGDIPSILSVVQKAGVRVVKILLTHGHIDHAGAAVTLAEKLSVDIEGPQPADAFWLDQLPEQGAMFGLVAGKVCTPSRWLEDGDSVRFGEIELQVLHTPGHTPGHVCFFHAASRLALVGDVLFAGSIGRTDFPRGDYQQLIHSIQRKLWPLGDDVRFIPGHGPISTFGEERANNPFVKD